MSIHELFSRIESVLSKERILTRVCMSLDLGQNRIIIEPLKTWQPETQTEWRKVFEVEMDETNGFVPRPDIPNWLHSRLDEDVVATKKNLQEEMKCFEKDAMDDGLPAESVPPEPFPFIFAPPDGSGLDHASFSESPSFLQDAASDISPAISAPSVSPSVPILKCSVCYKIYHSTVGLQRHVAQEHGDDGKGPFVCSHCGRSYQWRDSLKRHVKLEHSSGSATGFKCEVCGKNYHWRDSLVRHCKDEHPESTTTTKTNGGGCADGGSETPQPSSRDSKSPTSPFPDNDDADDDAERRKTITKLDVKDADDEDVEFRRIDEPSELSADDHSVPFKIQTLDAFSSSLPPSSRPDSLSFDEDPTPESRDNADRASPGNASLRPLNVAKRRIPATVALNPILKSVPVAERVHRGSRADQFKKRYVLKNGKVFCSSCQKFLSCSNWHKHEDSIHMRIIYQCDKCDKNFKWKNNLMRHQEVYH